MTDALMQVKAKDYLKRIRQLDDAAKAAIASVESLSSDIERITPVYTDSKVKGVSMDKEDAILRLIKAREKSIAAIDAYVDYKMRCLELIEQIPERYRRVLVMRYVEYASLKTIARKLYQSERGIKTLHGQALKEFEKVMEDEA